MRDLERCGRGRVDAFVLARTYTCENVGVVEVEAGLHPAGANFGMSVGEVALD